MCESVEYLPLIQSELHKLKYYACKITPLKNEVIGYLGRYYRLESRKIDEESVIIPNAVIFFLKVVPTQDTRQKNFIIQSGVFNTEINVYTLILSKIMDPGDNFIPRCITYAKDKFLILEDMESKGFKMEDKSKFLGFVSCETVLRTLGRFHGKCIIFEEQCERNLLDYFRVRDGYLHSSDRLMQQAIETDIRGIITIIDLIIDADSTLREKWERVKEFLKSGAHQYYKKINEIGKKKTLCHGDLWCNNILFKYDEDGRPIECCMIDFQLARYAAPALDIMLFLYFNTHGEMRRESFSEFLKIYYISLSETLRNRGLNVENVLPWQEFSKSIYELKKFAMTAAVAYLSIDLLQLHTEKSNTSATEKEIWDHLSLDTSPLVVRQFEEVSSYRDRILNSLMEIFDEVCRSDVEFLGN